MFIFLYKTKYFWLLAFLFVGLAGCQNSTQKQAYALELPSHFPAPEYNYARNPVSKEGIALGRKLFFDPILSKDSSISCGSCHHKPQAFADAGKQLSNGIHQQKTKRNTPGLFNLLWHKEFFADGGVTHFEFIPLAPLVNRQEMQGDLGELLRRLRGNTQYQADFAKAFGTDSLQSKHVLYALAQFTGTLISANAKYDRYVLGKTNLSLTEKQGLNIFNKKCESCHSTQNQLFTDLSYRNIGLDSISADVGRYRITENDKDRGLFKVPSLRNVMLTPPYMHDGRFGTLPQVFKHYNQGVKNAAGLDTTLKKRQRLGIPLTLAEQKALTAFLHTLTDSSFVK